MTEGILDRVPFQNVKILDMAVMEYEPEMKD